MLDQPLFEIKYPETGEWRAVPHVDESQMREVDRIAMEDFRLGILQMMENAGRNLASLAYRFLRTNMPQTHPNKVLVLAGSGGNGGGGICASRHLHNHAVEVQLALTKQVADLGYAAKAQLAILKSAGLAPMHENRLAESLSEADLVLDAVLGYSLKGAPRGTAMVFIERINQAGKPVIALDLPSGMDATSGQPPGVCVRADQTLCLALPKPGLINPLCGELFLADIGIPPEVYQPLGIEFDPFFASEYILPMRTVPSNL